MKDTWYDVEHRTRVLLWPWLLDGCQNTWLVTSVEVGSEFRGQGHASRLLTQVCAEADRMGATLILNIEPDGTGLDFDALQDFYRRHGFVGWHPPRTFEDEADYWNSMRRLPAAVTLGATA